MELCRAAELLVEVILCSKIKLCGVAELLAEVDLL
jgi:hypothetical protein